MTPVKLNLNIYRGSTYRKGFQWKTQPDDTPMNLTGCSIKMQMKTARGGDVLLECSTANGKITITDALNGRWQLALTPSDTLALSFSKAIYDLDITFLTTDVFTPIEGNVTVYEQVTT